MKRFVLFCLLGAILSGCSMLSPTPQVGGLPTEIVPTLIAGTLYARRLSETPPEPSATPSPTFLQEASPTPQETATSPDTPTATLSPLTPLTSPAPSGLPSRTPTITPTPRIPLAAIQVQSPGPGSKVLSPLTVRGWARSGEDGRIRIELFGEDGRLLVRKIVSYIDASKLVYVEEKVEFEIPGVAETGRLVISTFDKSGRPVSLAARDLLLLSVGENDITPAGDQTEPLVILDPQPNRLIQGGKLVVSGFIRAFNQQPLLVQLVAKDGSQPGYRQFIALPGGSGEYSPFSVEVPYQVAALTSVRLTINAYSDSRISGIIYTISEEIVLSP